LTALKGPAVSSANADSPVRQRDPLILLLVAVVLWCGQLVVSAANPTAEEQDRRRLESAVESLSAKIAASPEDDKLHSQRGDALFFLGRFEEAVADYDRMVELRPELDASHWRRGIAYYYAGRYADAAAQFERYHSFDDVDRENGIWRYLSQAMDKGREAARQELLKYEKDDREPFPDVYRLFAGEITPEQILSRIAEADIGKTEREKREFYAHLYIGLHLTVLQEDERALKHLEKGAANGWAPAAGYGPHFMWRVAKLHHARLKNKLTPQNSSADDRLGLMNTSCGCG
jgi:lipoprotein NlpI